MHSKAISTNSWITKIEDFTVVIITSQTNSGRTAFITHYTSPLLTELCHGTIFVSFLYLVARSSGIRFIVSYDADLIFCGSFWDLLVSLILRILLSMSSSASTQYNACWFRSGSLCSVSVVHPRYINHASTQYIPNMEEVTRLSQDFVCIFRSTLRVSCLWRLCWSISAQVL